MSLSLKIFLASIVVAGVGLGTFFYLKHPAPSSSKPITADSPTVAFLAIEGISGGSVDPKHTDAIEIKAFSWGGQKSSGSGTLSFSMLSGKASPMLFQALATGSHFKKAILSGSQGESTLEDVVITDYEQDAISPDSPPVDQVTLLFKKTVTVEQPLPKEEPKEVTVPSGTTTSGSSTTGSQIACGAHGTPNTAGGCTCDTSYTWNGQACVHIEVVPICSSPRAIDSSGNCVCPQGQNWNGETCATSVTQTPTCDQGMIWDGRSCVSATTTGSSCDRPRSLNSDGVCSCPTGQTWNGQTCNDTAIQYNGTYNFNIQ